MVREHGLNPLSFEPDIWRWKIPLKFKLQLSSLTFLMRNLLFAAEEYISLGTVCYECEVFSKL